jgi:hypothetical protein
MFEREWREEARQFHRDDTFRRRFDETEAASHRYDEDEVIKAQKIVMARWQKRGLWRPSWGRLCPDNDNAERADFVKPNPGMSWAFIEFHPAIAWDGQQPEFNFWKEACRNHYEQQIDSNISTPPSYPPASRPLQMFLYEVGLTRKSLPDDFQFAIDQYRDITAEYHETDPEAAVRRSWREDGLWSSEWSDLPGLSWPHERPDEEYERLAKAAGYNHVIAIMQDGSEHPFLQKGTGIDLRGATFKGETTTASNEMVDTNDAQGDATSSAPAQETTSGQKAAQAASTSAQSPAIPPMQDSERVIVEDPASTSRNSQPAQKKRAPRASALQSSATTSDLPKTMAPSSPSQNSVPRARSQGRAAPMASEMTRQSRTATTQAISPLSPPRQSSQSTSFAQTPASAKRPTRRSEPDTTATLARQSARAQPHDPEVLPSSPRLTKRKTDDEETFDQRSVRRARSARKDDENKPALAHPVQRATRALQTSVSAPAAESAINTKTKTKAKPQEKPKAQAQPKPPATPKPTRPRTRRPAVSGNADSSAPATTKEATKRNPAKASKVTEPKKATTTTSRAKKQTVDEAKKLPEAGVRRSTRVRKQA